MRILILDDDVAITETMALIFQGAGYEVAAFEQAHEALEYARSFPPDAALIDVRLQGQDGVSVATELISIAPSCEVLLMTGWIDAVARLEGADVAQGGRFELLTKPISPPELLEKVKAKLAGVVRA